MIERRASRSATFLPGSMRKLRPKTASGISAGSYRSRSGTNNNNNIINNVKDDANLNRIFPRQIDSFKYQLISLSYYKSFVDEGILDYSPTLRSYINVCF